MQDKMSNVKPQKTKSFFLSNLTLDALAGLCHSLTMTEPQVPVKRTRSPAYPAYSLPNAIDLARKLWNAQRKHEAHIDAALKALGYNSRNGAALRAIAALNHYGLIEEIGTGDDRKIKLSEGAQDILHLTEDDDRRRKAIQAAALSPSIYAALWERYGEHLPDDSAIKPFLVRDKGYNESTVDNLLEDYRATVEFAKPDKKDDNVRHEVKNQDDALLEQKSRQGGRAGMGMTLDQELPILVGGNRIARIPFPMSDDDFDLLLGTLQLWKKKIVRSEPPLDQPPKTDEEEQT
jgi:hypothetical protein